MPDTAPDAPTNRHEAQEDADFDLKAFFPYQVRIYYRSVSSSVSDIYGTLYGLTVPEWRTMAVLGPHRALSAGEIVERSSMDKVNVSRAISRLRERGFLKRDIDGDDRRRLVLRLTEDGRDAFKTLVPKLLDLEKTLLAGLSDAEVQELLRLMTKVRLNAEALDPVQSATDGE